MIRKIRRLFLSVDLLPCNRALDLVTREHIVLSVLVELREWSLSKLQQETESSLFLLNY